MEKYLSTEAYQPEEGEEDQTPKSQPEAKPGKIFKGQKTVPASSTSEGELPNLPRSPGRSDPVPGTSAGAKAGTSRGTGDQNNPTPGEGVNR